MTATGTLKTIRLGEHQQIQGVHVATLPDGRITVSLATKSCPPCKEAGFIYNYCAHCGCNEYDMAECPQAKLGRQTFTGKEIERTEG